MKTVTLRNGVQEDLGKYIKPSKREQCLITHGLTDERLREIEKYIRNAERGRLPITHDGADVTRQITAEQVAKFLACKDCQVKPVVSFQFKKRLVGVCVRHWIGLADTVIGWSGE
jgi:hypothetical protein